MWFRAVLAGGWNVYHDAASEYRMGRHHYRDLPCAGIPTVLLLKSKK